MKIVYHVVEVAHTKKGMPVVSVLRSFEDGEDKWGKFTTGKDKSNGYLDYLESDTNKRIFEVTTSSYGRS